jgi:hypothetical protein
VKQLLKKHFDQFEEGTEEISPQLLEKIYALKKERVTTIKKTFNLKKFSLSLASVMIIIALAIPIGIQLFNKDTDATKNPDKDKYVTPIDVGNGPLALSRNGNHNIAKALILAVDEYKERNKVTTTNNQIKYLSTRHSPSFLSTTEDTNPQDEETYFRYDFSFVDFYDTFEFYVDVDLENDFTANFEDTHFRVLISNVDLYIDNMTVWHSEAIIILINESGQMISYLTNGGSYRPEQVELEFSNHKWLEGSDVVKDIAVSPHYTLTLTTNYNDRFDLTYTEYQTKFTNQTDQFTFKTVKDSYYKVEDRIMFDLNNLVDRVATVTFLELIDETKFAFEYQGDIYYCLFDETIIDEKMFEILPGVDTLTIIFDGYFVGDSFNTISAQQITIKTYKPQEPVEETTDYQETEDMSDTNN